MNFGELARAEKDFEDAVKINGGNFFSFLNLALINYKQNDTRKINKYLISALKFEPDNPEIYKILGSLNSANPPVAITYYNKVLELQPFNKNVLLMNAALKKDNGFSKEAILDYKKLISGDPDNTEFYLVIAEIQVSLNELDSARFILKEACRIDSGNYEPFLMLARIYSFENDYNTAVYYYKETKKRIFSSYISLELGIQYQYLKKYQDAINELSNVIKVIKKELYSEKKELANTYYHLGICYDSISEQDKAIKNYNLAIDKNPVEPLYFNSWGDTFRRMKKYDLSMQDYIKSITVDSTFYEGYISVARQYQEISDSEKAIKSFHKAIEIDSSFSTAFLELSKIYFSKGDFVNSAFFATKAYLRDNSSTEGLFYQSMSELNLGEFEKSKNTFNSFIELNCQQRIYNKQQILNYLDSVIPEKEEAKELKQILIEFSCN